MPKADCVRAKVECPNKICNGYCPIKSEDEFFSLGVPKVIFANDGNLMYMSRTGVPSNKQGKFVFGYKQVCVYSFPVELVKVFYEHGKKTKFEEIEDLEMLRFVELGVPVHMVELSDNSIAVDFPEDKEKVLEVLKGRGEIH